MLSRDILAALFGASIRPHTSLTKNASACLCQPSAPRSNRMAPPPHNFTMLPSRIGSAAALLLAALAAPASSLSTVRLAHRTTAVHRPTASRIGVSSRPFATTSASARSISKPTPTTLSAVEGDFDPDAIKNSVAAIESGSVKARLRALYRFTRPHTIRGTVLASVAGTIRALVDTPGAIATADWGAMLPRAAVGMVALLLGNAFIVGINQIFDRDIDVLNKPFLPVASGEMSKRVAWLAVGASGIIGPAIV